MRPHFRIFFVPETVLQSSYFASATNSSRNGTLNIGSRILGILTRLLTYPLCPWRELLTGTKIEYSDIDFISPPDPEARLPYTITPDGSLVPFRASRPAGAYYPGDVGALCIMTMYRYLFIYRSDKLTLVSRLMTPTPTQHSLKSSSLRSMQIYQGKKGSGLNPFR